jgi:DnaJ-class molecular chaperone
MLLPNTLVLSNFGEKGSYRKAAFSVHPDKSRHPLSKDAFQKLQEAMTLSKNKI